MDRSAEKLAAVQKLWDAYRSIYTQNGLDIPAKHAEWSEQKRSALEKYHSREIFDALCNVGCEGLPLAILMAIIQPLRSFEKQLTTITGNTRQRKQKIRTLEKAAGALEDLLGSTTNAFVVDYRGPIDTNWAAETPPHPAIVIHALRTYASILHALVDAQKDTGVASSDMLAKYLFSAYVYRATGGFHDAEVSTLIGVALGSHYDETAHRMWRNRNYKRIDKRLSSIADILADFGEVSAT